MKLSKHARIQGEVAMRPTSLGTNSLSTKLATSATALALLFSACSSGSEESGADDEATAEAGAAQSEGTESEGSAEELIFESPIGEFLGATEANFNSEDQQARFAEMERKVQEEIAACMRAEGFEYTPLDQGQQVFFEGDESPDGLEWGSADWTAKYGYGVTTQRYSQAQVGDELVGHQWDNFDDGAGDDFTDPNAAYVESLTPSEQEAYYGALYGQDTFLEPPWFEEGREPTPEEEQAFFEEQEANYVPSGCEPVAYEEIFNSGDGFGFDEEAAQRLDEEFGDAFAEMEERMMSHPDVMAYDDEVRSCIEGQGLEYFSQVDGGGPWEYFEGLLEDAGLGYESFEDPLEGLDFENMTEEEIDEAYRTASEAPLPDDQLAALAELQELEISTALAERECGGGWEQRERALQSVRIEMEQQFLDDNADRLAEFEGVFGS